MISEVKFNAKIIGIDEVGRGPLAGPVTVCAVAINNDFDMKVFTGIKDSKKLSQKNREKWVEKFEKLKTDGLLDFRITSFDSNVIDNLGIAVAINKAVENCLDDFVFDSKGCLNNKVFLDGSLKAPNKFIQQETVIKGDEKIPVISIASIIAKVWRDNHMNHLALLYPEYGFEKNKGYGTEFHRKAIIKYGLTPIHRRSFCHF